VVVELVLFVFVFGCAVCVVNVKMVKLVVVVMFIEMWMIFSWCRAISIWVGWVMI